MSGIMFPSLFALFIFSLYISIPPCLSSLLFPVLSALHSKESTVTDPAVHTVLIIGRKKDLSFYQDQKLMKFCVILLNVVEGSIVIQ